MEAKGFAVSALGGAILEKPIVLEAIFGWSADEDKPKVPKCAFTPL